MSNHPSPDILFFIPEYNEDRAAFENETILRATREKSSVHLEEASTSRSINSRNTRNTRKACNTIQELCSFLEGCRYESTGLYLVVEGKDWAVVDEELY